MSRFRRGIAFGSGHIRVIRALMLNLA